MDSEWIFDSFLSQHPAKNPALNYNYTTEDFDETS
jgi:hypothetical protein